MQTLKDYLKTHTQQELATLMGLKRQQISAWVRGEHTISAESALNIERATAGQVQAKDLRPDIWPEEQQING